MSTDTYEYRSEFVRRIHGEGRDEGRVEGLAKGLADGRAEGRVEAVLLVLESRGITVGSMARARITETKDIAELDEWARRAALVGSVEELLA